MCQTRLPTFDLSFFARINSLFSKISDDVIAFDLRFGPPIQNPGYVYALNHVQCAYQIPVVASLYF